MNKHFKPMPIPTFHIEKRSSYDPVPRLRRKRASGSENSRIGKTKDDHRLQQE